MDLSYAELGDEEIFNSARFKKYVEGATNNVTVRCDAPDLNVALGHAPYTTPAGDSAPWYKAARPATGRFLGVMAVREQGAQDGSRSISITEVLGAGAVQSLARDASKELRIVVTLAALDKEAMNEGWVWFKELVLGSRCGDVALGCMGNILSMFVEAPATLLDYANFRRSFYRAELLEGPRIIRELPSKEIELVEAELIFNLGKPWPVTNVESVASLAMDTALNHLDAPGENCSEISVAYDNFITDPFYTAIQQPPRPSVILPPNLLDISSWRRKQVTIPSSLSDRPGTILPVVRVLAAGGGVQHMRIRFYRSTVVGSTGCDYDGEFYISYIPPWGVMTLDGIRREISVTMQDGRVVPAGHLLFGTDGRPFQWPELACHFTYNVVADMMPGQSGITVQVDAAVRE